jgi:hypothetical protein
MTPHRNRVSPWKDANAKDRAHKLPFAAGVRSQPAAPERRHGSADRDKSMAADSSPFCSWAVQIETASALLTRNMAGSMVTHAVAGKPIYHVWAGEFRPTNSITRDMCSYRA